MALQAGTRIGAYEVVALLGTGGMGEVYRAHDSKLRRDVAIKTLPAAVALDPDRLQRFEREAQVLASLNHPHVGAIYGFEEADGVCALVLELVEGPTLAERLASGSAIPVNEALAIARQIADALDAAHERGIVHRDLKPANIKVTPAGIVKVLDFGIAKALSPDSWNAADLTHTPTLTVGPTGEGALLGTAPYMSPEQARGRSVDKRADIWAFGCVLYEMLTGRAPFARDTIADTMAAILEREPDWTALPTAIPMTVRRLLERCLAKDLKGRLRDIGDARLEMDEALASPSTAPVESLRRKSAWTNARWIAALVMTAIATGVVAWNLKPRLSSAPSSSGSVARLAIVPPPTAPLAVDVATVALSPDGRSVAYVAGRGSRQQLYLRDLDQFNSFPVSGTEGGTNPFFSPDSQWLGFSSGGQLRKVLRSGGAPVTISDVPGMIPNWTSEPRWEADDTILFPLGLGAGIWRVPAAGGPPTSVTTLTETDTSHRWPQLLPGGRALLFSVLTGSQDAQAYIQSLETGQRRPVLKGSSVRYLPTGHLVYVRAGTLMAVPFDPVRLEVTGPSVAVLSGVMEMTRLRNSTVANLIPQVSFSTAGTMAYVPADKPRQTTLTWVDRTGLEMPTRASGGTYFQPRVSPDGRRVAVTVRGVDYDDVWLYDLTRETWSRFTSQGNSAFPLWTPDGLKLTYVSDKAGLDSMYWKPLDGGGPEERLLVSDRPNYPFSWRDGALVFVSPALRSAQDIWVLRTGQEVKATPFLETVFAEGAPAFSPDGRWLAYVSNESGRNEIHVRPFPGPGEKVTISAEGGNEPVWSRNGRELFYRSGDAMMAVEITTSPALTAGKARRLFEKPYEVSSALWADYDVTADGQRFMMVKRIDGNEVPAQINVVLNWFDELKRLVPPGRKE